MVNKKPKIRRTRSHKPRLSWLAALLAGLIGASICLPVTALAAPYPGYIYSYWGESVPAPNAYTPAALLTGASLGTQELLSPADMYASEQGLLYVLDSGNSRILVLDDELRLQRIIDGFKREGRRETFNQPEGIFVTAAGAIWVADTENSRLIELDANGRLIRELGVPQSEVLGSGFAYFPRKVAVDRAGRIYVIARGVYEGIIELDADGRFKGFVGTNRVRFDPLDYFWKSVSTKAQREKMVQFVPVEFNNMDLDGSGFIYTTTFERNSDTPVQKLNPTGVDVLRRQGYFLPVGDLTYTPSAFADVLVRSEGVYSVMDTYRGRIFTYNDDGNLLYIFGQMGSRLGTFRSPAAIESFGEHMLVLDREMGAITVFEPTRFGRLVNEANRLYTVGKHDESALVWEEVLKLDANYEIAYIGIGKALLRQGNYKEAMAYLKLGHDRDYYSKAFAKYRREYMRENFGVMMTAALLLAAAALAARRLHRARRERGSTHAV